MSTLDIESLLNSPDRADSDVAQIIIRRYYDRLFAVAYAIMGDTYDAEDAVQEAIIRAVSHIARYRPGSNFQAWILAICVNECRGSLRRRKRRSRLQDALKVFGIGNPTSRHPEEATQRHEEISTIWEALNQLDDSLRIPILLKIVNEHSVQEIATILGVKEKTVYTRMYRGYQRLRSALHGKLDQEN